jgi:hypothetical protein
MESCWKALRKCARGKRERNGNRHGRARLDREPLPGVSSKKKDLMTREGRVQAPDQLQQHKTRIRLAGALLVRWEKDKN